MESDGKIRLLRLLELLKAESDELHPISITQITAMMKERWGIEAYRTTIQKDVEALHAAGYEIETIRSTQNRYYLTSRTFELPELKLLLDAVESSKFITQKKSILFRILSKQLLKHFLALVSFQVYNQVYNLVCNLVYIHIFEQVLLLNNQYLFRFLHTFYSDVLHLPKNLWHILYQDKEDQKQTHHFHL